MADANISELPLGSALVGDELLPVVQGGVTKHVTTRSVANLSYGSKTIAVFTPKESQLLAAGAAALGTRNNIAVLDFDDTVKEGAFWVSIAPYGMVLSNGIRVTLWWMATTATSGNVSWGVKVENMSVGDLDTDSYDAPNIYIAATNPVSGALTSTTFIVTSTDGLTAQKPFRLLVERNGNDPSDTMVGDAELLCVEVWSNA